MSAGWTKLSQEPHRPCPSPPTAVLCPTCRARLSLTCSEASSHFPTQKGLSTPRHPPLLTLLFTARLAPARVL